MIPELKYLVTGVGHSGTGYMAELLASCGIKCSHEAVFTLTGTARMPNFHVDAESSFAAAPWLHHDEVRKKLRSCRIIYATRHPLRIIESFLRSGWSPVSEDMLVRPALGDMPHDALGYVCAKVVGWDRVILDSGIVNDTVMVEDRTKIVDRLGLAQVNEFDNASKNKHHGSDLYAITGGSVLERCRASLKRGKTLTWDDVPREVARLAERQGYA